MKHKRVKQKQSTIKPSQRPRAKARVQSKPHISSKSAKMSKKTKIAIFCISLIVLIAGFVLFMELNSFFSALNETPENTLPADEALVPIDPEEGKINVLILGLDKDGYRTDTIIVASYDLENNTVNMLSIPRDTRMYVGKHYQKINCAYAIKEDGKMKGVSGTIEAVNRLTGIDIHHYVVFECNTFREVIDALGGVDFDVPQNMNYDDPVQNLHIHLKKGFQHLDGDKAEQLVRFRKYPTGDIKRVEVQQDFVKAIATQKINVAIIGKLPELFKVWKENIKMSFTAGDVVRYSGNLLGLKSENIKAYLLPGAADGTHYGASYWIADMDEVKTLVEGTFGYDASKITIHSPDGKSAANDKKKQTTSVTKTTETGGKTETEKPKTTTETGEKPKTTEKDTDKEKNKSDTVNAGGGVVEKDNSGTQKVKEEKTGTNDDGPKRPVANDEE